MGRMVIHKAAGEFPTITYINQDNGLYLLLIFQGEKRCPMFLRKDVSENVCENGVNPLYELLPDQYPSGESLGWPLSSFCCVLGSYLNVVETYETRKDVALKVAKATFVFV